MTNPDTHTWTCWVNSVPGSLARSGLEGRRTVVRSAATATPKPCRGVSAQLIRTVQRLTAYRDESRRMFESPPSALLGIAIQATYLA